MNISTKYSSCKVSFDLASICRNMSEYSPEPIVAVEGASSIIRYLNQAFCKLIGKLDCEMIGKSFFEAIPETRSNGCLEMFERVLRTRLPESLCNEARTDRKQESWTYSSWIALGRNARPAGIIIHITAVATTSKVQNLSTAMNQALLLSSLDLTERTEKLNIELQNATQAKNQFLAAMSHEIRTPLNAITGFAEMLSFAEVNPENRRLFGECIKRNTFLLLRLIDDIIDLSRIESGKLDIKNSLINLPELLSDIILIMKNLSDAKNIELLITIDHTVPKIIMCDPVRLKQILINVIGNAVKFTTWGSVKIAVNVSPSSKMLRITVIDTGAGISYQESLNLFQPFTQGDATTTRKFGGAGLGLDLSRRLARGLGGDVKLLKSARGEGSEFEITVLDVKGSAEKDLESHIISDSHLSECRLDGVHVLLAEDAPDNQFLVSEYLTSVGASVDIAENGEVAIEMANQDHYDVILMDIQMPKVDGYIATSRIRERGYIEPIIALTAHAMQGERERCQQAGCDRFMTKPVDRIDLINTINQMVVLKGTRSFPRLNLFN